MPPFKGTYKAIIRHLLSIVFVFVSFVSVAQNTREKIKDQIFNDTLGSKAFVKTDLQSHSFYDTMRNSNSWFVRTLASLLIGGRSSADDSYAIKENVVSRDYFTTFSGKVITKINIVNANIFSRTENDDLSWIESTLDKLHIKTKYDVIEKNLLFKVGQQLDPYKMTINEQLLRNKPYLATAFFILVPDKHNPNGVTVNVFTRDNWTISAGGVLGGNPRGDIYDRNFLGSGNMLMVSYYPKTDNQYDALELKYFINNLGGTFADGELKIGIGSTNNAILLDVNRPFLMPSDHLWGVRMGYVEESQGMRTFDTMTQVKKEEIGLYYGYSFNLDPKMGTAAYFTVAPRFHKFTRKIPVSRYEHPSFTDQFSIMANVGISQQNFFQSNMIYGFGRTEDIPYGFQLELIGGWQHNMTLGKRWYVGALARWGNLTPAGYFDITASWGSYINQMKFEQMQLGAQIKYFSPLMDLGSFYLRQFANITYTHGLHRLQGERELLAYENGAKVHGVRIPHSSLGTSRLTISAETVFFTPIFFYHFRFAFYGWADAGWLGKNDLFFRNDFSSAIGLGVRIKNERLIFDNIQIRVGISLSRPSGANFNWFDIGDEYYLRVNHYVPSAASPPSFD